MKKIIKTLSNVSKKSGLVWLVSLMIISWTILTSQLINATFHAEEVLPRVPNQITMKWWEANAETSWGYSFFIASQEKLVGWECDYYDWNNYWLTAETAQIHHNSFAGYGHRWICVK